MDLLSLRGDPVLSLYEKFSCYRSAHGASGSSAGCPPCETPTFRLTKRLLGGQLIVDAQFTFTEDLPSRKRRSADSPEIGDPVKAVSEWSESDWNTSPEPHSPREAARVRHLDDIESPA